jgi:hypothetical protein
MSFLAEVFAKNHNEESIDLSAPLNKENLGM